MVRLILAGVLLFAVLALPARAGDLEQRWESAPEPRIQLEIVSGKIEIEGWKRPEVALEANGDGAGALVVEASPERVVIHARRSGFPWPDFGWASDVDLRLHVPEGSRIEARTINGPIEIKDVNGTLRLQAVNGSIKVKGAPSEASLETVNAKIEFEGRRSRVDARTVNGKIELEGVAHEVEATAVNGAIEVVASQLQRADLSTVSGSIELETTLAPGARIQGKTHNGSIRLRLPEDTSARIQVETFTGSIRSELGANGVRSQHGPGQRLDHEVGEGDARISIDTFSGSVQIESFEPDED